MSPLQSTPARGITETTLMAPATRVPPQRRGWGRLLTVLAIISVLILSVGWGIRQVLSHIVLFEGCSATALGKTATLDPEQMGNAAIITAIAGKRNLPTRAATIAIATAMQESKLRNINYGDRDSIGLFQQRPSQGWGTVQQIQDPVYASNAFYDVLIKVEGYESIAVTEAAQKVQRSAFGAAYAEHEAEARIFASALAGYSPGGATCTLRSIDLPAEATRASGFTPRAQTVATALSSNTGAKAIPVAGSNGTMLALHLSGRESGRQGWAVAHWAVARAAELSITEVNTDNQSWKRNTSKDGWTTAKTTPSGEVVIKVT